MSLYIATLAEVKADLGIEHTDYDAVLTEWMEGLQGRFDSFCNRVLLYSASETEYFNGGGSSLLLRRWPIESISSIIVDADQEWDADDALDSDDYRLNYRRGRIVYGTGTYKWPAGFQNIRVVYAGGFVKSDGSACTYVDATELDALRRAFFMQFGFEWRNRETLGVTQFSRDGASRQVGAGVALALKEKTLMPEVASTLTPFMRL